MFQKILVFCYLHHIETVVAQQIFYCLLPGGSNGIPKPAATAKPKPPKCKKPESTEDQDTNVEKTKLKKPKTKLKMKTKQNNNNEDTAIMLTTYIRVHPPAPF